MTYAASSRRLPRGKVRCTVGDDIVPIPGTRHLLAVKENIAAADIFLSAADLAELKNALPPAKGECYGAAMMANLDM